MGNNFVVYLSRIYIANFKCFKGINDINLLDNDGNLVQWTIILGNNNSGKTTILKAIADLEPKSVAGYKGKGLKAECFPLNLFRNVKSIPNEPNKDDKTQFIGCDFIYKPKKSSKQYISGQFSKYPDNDEKSLQKSLPNWGYKPNSIFTGDKYDILGNLQFYGYGVTRRTGSKGLNDKDDFLNSISLFETEKQLINIEDWLLQLDYSAKNKKKSAKETLDKVISLIKSDVFPDLFDIRFITSSELKNFVEFKTLDGWFKYNELGYGYQTTLSWLIDFCKKLFERYPRSKNPLKEPAILLLDEIDLHLHPSWQRNVIKFLSETFSSTQFIVTTHSPLVIQSLGKVNLLVLEKQNGYSVIKKAPKISYLGWSVEEILEDVLDMGDKTYSDIYKELIRNFDEALDSDDYKSALQIYHRLDKILHPNSPERKLMQIQLSQISKNDKN